MKRLNVKLALWLVGITIFSVVGVHFLHGYQIGRNAEYLKLQAERAEKDGEVKEAIKLYNQYLKHRDDEEGYSVLAKLVYEDATEPKATRQTQLCAYNNLAEAVRRHPELKDVTRRMIDFTMHVGSFQDAIENIKRLKEQGEKSVDLDLKLARCYYQSREEDLALKTLYQIVGYDPTTEQFSGESAPGAHEVDAYELLSAILAQTGWSAKKRKSDVAVGGLESRIRHGSPGAWALSDWRGGADAHGDGRRARHPDQARTRGESRVRPRD